jgi:hypothetical protein
MLLLLLLIIAAVHNMLLSCLPRHNSYPYLTASWTLLCLLNSYPF